MNDKILENEFLNEIKEMQILEQQIKESRVLESQKIDSMTDEEEIEYLKSKEQRAESGAKSCGMSQKLVMYNDKKEG